MERSWRLVATTLLFTVFGAGGLIAGFTVIPAIALVSRDPRVRARRARAAVGASFRWFFLLMRRLRVAHFKVDRETLASLAAQRGNVVVANHPTLIDVVILLAYIEQANCVVKSAVWHNPVMRWAVRCARYIPNEDPETLLVSCERALRAGETLIVFPEATRTVPGQPLQLQRGAANIALRAGAAVNIVRINCEPATLCKAEPWYHVPKQRPRLSVSLCGGLQPHDFLRPGEHVGLAARRLTSALQTALSEEVHR